MEVLAIRLVQVLVAEVHNLTANLERIIFAVASLFIQDRSTLLILALQVDADDDAQKRRDEPKRGHESPGQSEARAVLWLPEPAMAS